MATKKATETAGPPRPAAKRGLPEKALELHALGWFVIPTAGRTPLVGWRRMRTAPPDIDELIGWFSRPEATGMARVLGWPGDRTWVLDADGPTAAAWAEANAPETPAMVKTRRGAHLYYRTPEGTEPRGMINAAPGLPDGNRIDVWTAGYVPIPPTPGHRWLLADLRGPAESSAWASLPEWTPPAGGRGGRAREGAGRWSN